MQLLRAAVLAAVVVTGWCDAQGPVPQPRPFGTSRPSTDERGSFGTRRPSGDRGNRVFGTRRPGDDNNVFTTDTDLGTFPGQSTFTSGGTDGIIGPNIVTGRPTLVTGRPDFVTGRPDFGTGRPNVFLQGGSFRPSNQGFGTPSTSFGTPAPGTFGAQGGVGVQPFFFQPGNTLVGQGGFRNPNAFTGQTGFGTPGFIGQTGFGGSPNTFTGQSGFVPGAFAGQQGGFVRPTNTFTGQGGLGTASTLPVQSGFGSFIPGSALPRQGGTVFNTGLTSGGGSSRFPSTTQLGGGLGGFIFLDQNGVPVVGVPVQNFLQSPLSFSQGGLPINSFGQGGTVPFGFNQVPGNIPPVFPSSPVGTSFGSTSDDRRSSTIDTSSGTLTPRFPNPNSRRRVVFSGKSGKPATSSDSSSSASTKASTKAESN